MLLAPGKEARAAEAEGAATVPDACPRPTAPPHRPSPAFAVPFAIRRISANSPTGGVPPSPVGEPFPFARIAVDNRGVSVRPLRVLAPLILVSALFFAPAHAGAAAIQFGSSLAPGPVVTFGCNAKPSLYDASGNYGLFVNNEPGGCTWSQAGVWGLNSGSDPRTRSVPSDGRIVAAEVLSGAQPSPISITIFKQLAQPGGWGRRLLLLRP